MEATVKLKVEFEIEIPECHDVFTDTIDDAAHNWIKKNFEKWFQGMYFKITNFETLEIINEDVNL